MPRILPKTLVTQEMRRRFEDLHLAFVVWKQVSKERGLWRNPEMKAQSDATDASRLGGGVDAAISARAADQFNEALCQEVWSEEGNPF